MTKYIVITREDLSKVDFEKCQQSSKFTMRYSVDKQKAVLKYTDDQPDFVYCITGDTVGLPEYTHEEIFELMETAEWKIPN